MDNEMDLMMQRKSQIIQTSEPQYFQPEHRLDVSSWEEERRIKVADVLKERLAEQEPAVYSMAGLLQEMKASNEAKIQSRMMEKGDTLLKRYTRYGRGNTD